MKRALAVIWIVSFAAQIISRIVDPVLPQIASDLYVDVRSAALLATAFALPWALSQPILGPAGDLLGKVRVILIGMTVLALSAFAGAFATDFTVLFVSRIVSGIAAAAVSPVAFALAADLLTPEERQVGIGRVLTASISGQLLGAVGAGFLGDLVGWRGVLVAGGAGVAFATAWAVIGFQGVLETRSGPPGVATALANYRTIFSNPHAKICFGAVFFEGVAMHGILPFIASMLAAAGQPRASVAGLVIAGVALGGFIYALSVRPLTSRFNSRQLMTAGGAFAALALVLQGSMPPWPVQALAMTLLGFGFFMLHNGIQVKMLELAPHARGSSVAMHAFFLFTGQAIGPVVYGQALPVMGAPATTLVMGSVLLATGITCARLLQGQPRHGGAQPS
jgi:predicted MFS family arabinose efflux permease